MNNCSNDCGGTPFVADIRAAALKNEAFRTTFWTGDHLQCTLMCIPECCDIGTEEHIDTDQLLCIEEGCCRFVFCCPDGKGKTEKCAGSGDSFFVPAGTIHNVVNIGSCPLKLFSLYAPPHHRKGIVEHNK